MTTQTTALGDSYLLVVQHRARQRLLRFDCPLRRCAPLADLPRPQTVHSTRCLTTNLTGNSQAKQVCGMLCVRPLQAQSLQLLLQRSTTTSSQTPQPDSTRRRKPTTPKNTHTHTSQSSAQQEHTKTPHAATSRTAATACQGRGEEKKSAHNSPVAFTLLH